MHPNHHHGQCGPRVLLHPGLGLILSPNSRGSNPSSVWQSQAPWPHDHMYSFSGSVRFRAVQLVDLLLKSGLCPVQASMALDSCWLLC